MQVVMIMTVGIMRFLVNDAKADDMPRRINMIQYSCMQVLTIEEQCIAGLKIRIRRFARVFAEAKRSVRHSLQVLSEYIRKDG